MTYELHGIKINCADGISQEEAAIYLNNQLQVKPFLQYFVFISLINFSIYNI